MGYDNLETEMYDLKTEISDLSSKISGISSDVDKINRIVGSYYGYRASTIYDIAEKIEGSIPGFCTEIDALKSSLSRIEEFIDAFERREAEARFDRFWDRNKEYQLELKNKLASLKREISYLEKLITANPLNEQIADLKSKQKSRQSEKDKLSLFDYKGKKDIKNEITQLNNMLAQANEQLLIEIAPLAGRIDVLQQEIAKVNDELTKPR